ncbi:MAG: hypothetical protein PHS88_07270 [Candidatus Omnitrophica bacterium]|jgi:pyrrolidone-carboxylate peptidase|nr:hypothetical protein [Candidatus Omnitrophota bacterium]
MKILVYGFSPYKNYSENITERIIRKIRNRKDLTKIIFPVAFQKHIFLEKIRKNNPGVILGLGQHPRSKKMRIERKAVNLKRENKQEQAKIISKNKPAHLFINVKLKKDNNSWISYDAGKYVCNFSMYVISDFSKNKNIKFAFIHIPKDYSVNKAVKFVESKIDEMIKTPFS